MNLWRRYGRWLKRIAIFVGLYIGIAYLLIGVSPGDALLHPGQNLASYRIFLVQLIFVTLFILVQFVAMFWFVSRGNDYVIYPGEYDVTFDDVRGQPAAVESTQEVLRLFQGFKDFKQMGGYPPHGILFEGPPGTGKTLMAKAVAGATGVPFLYATGSGFANMFMGIGNLKVRRLFTKARTMSDKYGGAVIFIDELDALGGSRGLVSERSTPVGETDRPARIVMGGLGMGGGMGIVNELLVQMDGLIVPRGIWRHVRRVVFRAKPKVPFYNVMIIGATNRASTLDTALLRPGRFDRKIHVGLPDSEGREDIARYSLAKVRHEPIDSKKLARMTKGYSPAMLKNIVNEALIFALQDGRDALRWDDLWQAKLAEEIGLKQPVTYSDPEEVWFGQTTSGPSSDLQAATQIAAVYVGVYGMGKSLVSAAAVQDPMMGGNVVSAVLSDAERRKEVDAILNDCRRRVRALLVEKTHVVEGVRDALLEREELIGDEIEALMADLGEREPIEVGVAAPGGTPGPRSPFDTGAGGNGAGGNGHRGSDADDPP